MTPCLVAGDLWRQFFFVHQDKAVVGHDMDFRVPPAVDFLHHSGKSFNLQIKVSYEAFCALMAKIIQRLMAEDHEEFSKIPRHFRKVFQLSDFPTVRPKAFHKGKTVSARPHVHPIDQRMKAVSLMGKPYFGTCNGHQGAHAYGCDRGKTRAQRGDPYIQPGQGLPDLVGAIIAKAIHDNHGTPAFGLPNLFFKVLGHCRRPWDFGCVPTFEKIKEELVHGIQVIPIETICNFPHQGKFAVHCEMPDLQVSAIQ